MTRPRLMDSAVKVGILERGSRNLITDVHPIMVGHCTLIKGNHTRTGVTIVDPGTSNLYRNKLSAASAVGNGYGKLAGVTQIDELGTLESPIALTNTLAVGATMGGLIDVVRRTSFDIGPEDTINAVVGETNDGFLNSIHQRVVRRRHVEKAFANRDLDFQLGAVGAGTGTRAFAWKGGIGSASRVLERGGQPCTVGALVQTNFGGSFTFLNVPIGRLLKLEDFTGYIGPKVAGSCMIILATDAALSARALHRLAKRGLLGLTRTGSIMAEGSGEYAIAFSTSQEKQLQNDDELDRLFLAAAEAVEESVYDAMFTAETMYGRDGNIQPALPVDVVLEYFERHRRALQL